MPPLSSRARTAALCGLLCVTLLAAGCQPGRARSAPGPGAPRALPLLVLEGSAAATWRRLLRASGAAVQVGTAASLAHAQAVVVPTGSATDARTRAQLVAWVRHGGRLASADDALLTALGVRRAAGQRVSSVAAAVGRPAARWPQRIGVLPLADDGSTVLARADTGGALVSVQPLGRGSVLAMAVDPLARGRAGYELLPWLGQDLRTWSGAMAGPERLGAEVYLDPGHLPADAKSPQQLAERLEGVRAVAIAGWNDDFTHPSDNYDYDGLIAALHARGISAYAWLEPPFVSLRLWEQHPECREKNAGGKDARGDWRLLIALEEPACYARSWEVWHRLLTRHDWDGVDLAEMYLEPAGPAGGQTPFSAAALRQFAGSPAAEPGRFARFRTALVTSLTRRLLTDLNGLPSASQLELQVTTIDDTLDPGYARQLGVNDALLAPVVATSGATLQVEDPFTVWARSPLRYAGVATAVQGRMPPGATSVDVNVVPRAQGTTPTSSMTGDELALALGAAAGSSGRVGLYAFGTLEPDDRHLWSDAPAAAADLGLDRVEAPWTVRVRAGARWTRLLVDGRPWPVGAGVAVLPPGRHTLAWSTGAAVGPGLVSLNAELGTASVAPDALQLTYDARTRARAVVTERVRSLTVDEGPATVTQVPHPGGGWVITLPKGTHGVVLRF